MCVDGCVGSDWLIIWRLAAGSVSAAVVEDYTLALTPRSHTRIKRFIHKVTFPHVAGVGSAQVLKYSPHTRGGEAKVRSVC